MKPGKNSEHELAVRAVFDAVFINLLIRRGQLIQFGHQIVLVKCTNDIRELPFKDGIRVEAVLISLKMSVYDIYLSVTFFRIVAMFSSDFRNPKPCFTIVALANNRTSSIFGLIGIAAPAESGNFGKKLRAKN